MRIAYITDKSMHIWDNGKKIDIPSQYLKSYKTNLETIQRRREWKQKSTAAAMGYGEMMPGFTPNNAAADRFRFTGLTRYGRTKSLIYAIEIEEMGGMFKVNPFNAGDSEGHVYHDKGISINNPCYSSKNSTLVYSLREPDGQAHIEAQNLKKDTSMTLTDGDSVDDYPSWVDGDPDTIVYQSAGIGRNTHGLFVGLAPSTIHTMDIKTGEIEELLQYNRYDCLAPQMDAEGNIFFIKRPYKTDTHDRGNFFLDILMFPIRLINAIFHFLNAFTMMFSGKPLTPGPNPARQDADPRKIMIHGNLIDAQKIIDDANKPGSGKTPGIVPRSWQLIKFTPDGREHVLSDGVISFDRAPDGTIYCCDGRQVYSLDEKGKKSTLLKEKFIEKIYVF